MTKKETKKSRLARCRALIDRQMFDQMFSEADLDEFYEITGAPVLAAVRTTNPTWPNDPRHVRVQILDGVWEELSWVDCINGCNSRSELKKVLRGEIGSDLVDFLSAIEPRECSRCKSTANLTVDHKDEPFDSIAEAFIATHGQIEIAVGPSGSNDIIADRDLAAEWIQFHAGRAVYQVLCRSCNASKGKR